jgi:hypothetical protein
MFDDEEFEKRKKNMERLKVQAMDKVRLPPLSGNHSTPSEQVYNAQLMTRDDAWLFYFINNEQTRIGHGVTTKDGKWVITDQAKFDRYVDTVKKDKLRAIWAEHNKDHNDQTD